MNSPEVVGTIDGRKRNVCSFGFHGIISRFGIEVKYVLVGIAVVELCGRFGLPIKNIVVFYGIQKVGISSIVDTIPKGIGKSQIDTHGNLSGITLAVLSD